MVTSSYAYQYAQPATPKVYTPIAQAQVVPYAKRSPQEQAVLDAEVARQNAARAKLTGGGTISGTGGGTISGTGGASTGKTSALGSAVGGYAYPDFTVDLAGIWETAGAMADNEINPQLVEIDRLLQDAGYSADESQRAINEAYPIARRSLQKSIYENMVAGEGSLAAMGTGRGGGRQELIARAGEREATGIEGIETQKMREQGAIQRALENYKAQMGATRTGLLGQRGNLQNTYAEQIRGNRFNEAGVAYNAALGKANLAESARQFNESLAASTSATSGSGGMFDLGNYGNGVTYSYTPEEINSLFGVNLPALTKKATLPSTFKSKQVANLGAWG